MKKMFFFYFIAVITGCNNNQPSKKLEMNNKTIGTIERFDPALNNIISPYSRSLQTPQDGSLQDQRGPFGSGQRQPFLAFL